MKTALLLLGLIAGLTSLPARTVDVPSDSISLDLPDDWVQGDSPDLLLSASAPGNGSAVQLRKFSNPRNQEIDDVMVGNFKHGISDKSTQAGSTVTFGDEGPLTLGGAPAYQIQAQSTSSQNTTTSVHFYLVDANASFYVLLLVSNGSTWDPQLQAVADSFRFTSPPRMPVSTFERRAYKLGLLAGVLLVLAVAGLLVWRFAVRRG